MKTLNMKNPAATLSLVICFACAAPLIAQKEANIWYFGAYAGLDFNSGSPVALTNGALATFEGCASIADRTTGQLLFYTEGINVWNKRHTQMTNGSGLFGDGSSSQSAVIVPMPGSLTQYYIFTADQGGYVGPNRGINYSIVDMTLSGGLGAVTTKNTFLLIPATEKIAAVVHANRKNTWVVSHEFNSDKFYAWLVTNAGVSSPVITSIGSVHSGSPNNTIGYLKSSPDGKHLALACYMMNTVELFDFDNATGVVANVIMLPSNTDEYGLSFSPDSKLLYVSNTVTAPSTGIYQYNLLAGSPAAIIASKTTIDSSQRYYGALQIAPDGKIYVAQAFPDTNSRYLGVITDPNVLGTGCHYVVQGVYLDGRISTWGLPDFVESYFSLARLEACVGAESIATKKPGDEALLPITLTNTKPARNAVRINVAMHYETDLLRIAGKATSSFGEVDRDSLDEARGNYSWSVHLTDSLITNDVVISSVPVQALLSSRLNGNIDIVTATIENSGDTLTATGCSVPFTLSDDCILSSELTPRGGVVLTTLYPNPSHGEVVVSLRAAQAGTLTVELCDIFGRVVLRKEVVAERGDTHVPLALDLPAGIYFCRVAGQRGLSVRPLCVE